MPHEKRKAIQEGEQIGASDAWFKARHEMLDTLDRRNVFRAGFDRGWNAALAAQGCAPQPTPLSDDVVRDAARYRWLRATTNYVTSNGERIDVRNMPEKWDSAIDAALATQGGK